jgi:hypothetical protein
MAVHRYGYTVTLLPDDKVLVAGGSDEDAADASAALASAELFDPGPGAPADEGSGNDSRQARGG